VLSDLKIFINEFEEGEMNDVQEALKEVVNEIKRGATCSGCRRPYETKEESRSAYLVRDRYVCQLCYHETKVGCWDHRKRNKERN